MRMRLQDRLRITIGATALAVALAAGTSAGAVSLGLTPSGPVAPGGAVAIGIVIADLGDGVPPTLAAFDLDVSFDPGVLAFVSVDFGAELGTPGVDALVTSGLLAGPARVDLATSWLLPNAMLDAQQPSSFVLATLHFIALAPGTSLLDFTQAVLANTAGGPGGNAITAELSGASATVVPEPGPLALIALGMALLTRRPWSR
jgi:hypothetical protein